jgi:16S rRNA (cytidine1402-2'-O)-methyltransferase
MHLWVCHGLQCARTRRVSRSGQVILAATPLGNPADASLRLRDLIAEADIIAAEDTRRFRRLASDLNVTYTARLVSFFEAVEQAKAGDLAQAAADGSLVLMVTDAGMPSVSDPGYRLVAACRAVGVPVSVVPGPSAVTTALAVSGLASDRFCFEGFLPRKAGERQRRLSALAEEPRTLVFFEAPHRIAAALAAMVEAFGADRQAVVCRELTKTYEEVRPDDLAALAAWAGGGLRGEITIVVAGAVPGVLELTDEELADRVARLIADGADRKAAISTVAKETARPKRQVYDAVLAAKSNK